MIEGTLDEFSLSDVVRLIARARKTGVLALSSAGGRGAIYFSEGAVCGARCVRGREPLGRKLVRAAGLSEKQVRDALAATASEGVRLGEALVAAGLVGHADVADALKEQVEDSVAGLLRSDPSAFEWHPGEPVEEIVAIDADAFLAGVEARRLQWDEIEARLPLERGTVALGAVPPQDLSALSLTAEEWRLLAVLTARRPITDVVRYSGVGEFHALRAIDRLVSSGLLEVSGPGRARWRPVPLAAPEVAVPVTRVIRLPESPAPPRASQRFRIAVISTSDRTRGPLAAALLRRAAAGFPVEIDSYATEDASGAPPTAQAVAAADELGIEMTGHRSHRIEPGNLGGADLVLGFERRHVWEAVGRGGARRERAFTLLEFLTLLGSLEGPSGIVSAGRTLVERADVLRSVSPPAGDVPLDMPPRGASVVDLARFIGRASARTVGALFGYTTLEKSG